MVNLLVLFRFGGFGGLRNLVAFGLNCCFDLDQRHSTVVLFVDKVRRSPCIIGVYSLLLAGLECAM